MIRVLLVTLLLCSTATAREIKYDDLYARVANGETLYVSQGHPGELECTKIPGHPETGVFKCYSVKGEPHIEFTGDQVYVHEDYTVPTGAAVVVVTSPTCGPCHHLMAAIKASGALADKLAGRPVIRLDVSRFPSDAAAYPTVIVYDNNGKVTSTLVGPSVQQLSEVLK